MTTENAIDRCELLEGCGDPFDVMLFSMLDPTHGIFTAVVCNGHFLIAPNDEYLKIRVIMDRLKKAGYYEEGAPELTREIAQLAFDDDLETL